MGKNDGYDNMGVESIIEDDSSLYPRLPLHKNLDDSLVRAEDHELQVAHSSMMQTPITQGGFTRNNQKSILVQGTNHLTHTQRSNNNNNYIRIETAHSHENSPKARMDIVERVIEENFNWTKYY